MITDAKILVTGAGGTVATPFIRYLAPHNEVWGAARFSREGSKEQVEALGAKPVTVDLASGDLSALPDDFTHVLHLAHYRGQPNDVHEAIRNNGEGTGHLLYHCRKARAALVMSSGAVYSAVEDPWDFPTEDSVVWVHYTGKLADGTVFDQSQDPQIPIEGIFPEGTPLPLSEMIPGMRDALMQTQVGGKYEIFIPAAQAYGEDVPEGGPIPPNSDLYFEVEVTAIMTQEDFQAKIAQFQQQMMQQQLDGAGAGGAAEGGAAAGGAAPAQ